MPKTTTILIETSFPPVPVKIGDYILAQAEVLQAFGHQLRGPVKILSFHKCPLWQASAEVCQHRYKCASKGVRMCLDIGLRKDQGNSWCIKDGNFEFLKSDEVEIKDKIESLVV
jgi:hypothetical protein